MASEYGTKEWWDEHRAGAYGGYKGGYSSADDPYRGVKQDEIDRESSRKSWKAENDKFHADQKRRREKDQNWLNSMTLEDRLKELNRRKDQKEREEILSSMTPAERSRYYQNERDYREFQRIDNNIKKEQQERENRLESFKKAKERYKNLNIFKKIKLIIAGKTPKNINPYKTEAEELDRLYRR